MIVSNINLEIIFYEPAFHQIRNNKTKTQMTTKNVPMKTIKNPTI